MALLPGTRIGPYDVTGLLGTRGHGRSGDAIAMTTMPRHAYLGYG